MRNSNYLVEECGFESEVPLLERPAIGTQEGDDYYGYNRERPHESERGSHNPGLLSGFDDSPTISTSTPASNLVMAVQNMLYRWGYYAYNASVFEWWPAGGCVQSNTQIDGYFGVCTEYAVAHFQYDHGMGTYGYVGPTTYNRLQAGTSTHAHAHGSENPVCYDPLSYGWFGNCYFRHAHHPDGADHVPMRGVGAKHLWRFLHHSGCGYTWAYHFEHGPCEPGPLY